jgi:hypothetical protein
MKSYVINSETASTLTLLANNKAGNDFEEIIFDNKDASAVFVRKRKGTEKKAKLPYQDIEKFALRTEIEYSRNHGNTHNRSSTTTYYVVYLIKKDGGILDLNYFSDESAANEFQLRLQKFAQLNKVCNNLMKPEKYDGFEVSSFTGPIEIKWKNTGAAKNIGKLIITLLIIGGLGYAMSYLPSEVLNDGFFILFVSIFCFIFLLVIVLIFVVRRILGKKGRVAGMGGYYIVCIDSKELSLIYEKNENRTVINKVSINNIYCVYSSCYSDANNDKSPVGVSTKDGLKNMYMFDSGISKAAGSSDERGIFEKFETMINNDENFSFEAPGMDMIDKMHFESLIQKYIKEKSGRDVL